MLVAGTPITVVTSITALLVAVLGCLLALALRRYWQHSVAGSAVGSLLVALCC